jgi:chromosome partitioning protein
MTTVVPFMNGKGGTGKSTLARSFAVESAKAGASVILADLNESQHTSVEWAKARRQHGHKPEIDARPLTWRGTEALVGQSDMLVVDTGGWVDQLSVQIAKRATYIVMPCGPNLLDDVRATVTLAHKLTLENVLPWRFGIVLSRFRANSVDADEKAARDAIAGAGYTVLPGVIRDLKTFGDTLSDGLAITETDRPALNKEAFAMLGGIAEAVREAGKRWERARKAERQREMEGGREL